MKSHPYLRAYMAGVAVPTIFLLFVFAAFCVIRLGYNPDLPMERILVFPLALVPAIWGGWNMVYLALRGYRRLPLGMHGALVPAILVPLALVAARAFGFDPRSVTGAIPIIVVLLMIIYYLVWKYLVGFLNDMLGIG
ncbi:MAG: hypothetical protein LAP87_25515 [Acidobacteriia bacterium]|nr:hypothetical protein [Terriglobia bacterium]